MYMKESFDPQKTTLKPIAQAKILLAFFVFMLLIFYFYLTPKPETISQQTQTTQSTTEISPDKLQNGVRSMADMMVKQDNRIGLRMWAKSLGVSAPSFSSSETMLVTIKKYSNDFSLYRDKKEVLKLAKVISSQDLIFDEVLLQSVKEGK